VILFLIVLGVIILAVLAVAERLGRKWYYVPIAFAGIILALIIYIWAIL